MRENRSYGSEGGEAQSLPYPYQSRRLGPHWIASPSARNDDDGRIWGRDLGTQYWTNRTRMTASMHLIG